MKSYWPPHWSTALLFSSSSALVFFSALFVSIALRTGCALCPQPAGPHTSEVKTRTYLAFGGCTSGGRAWRPMYGETSSSRLLRSSPQDTSTSRPARRKRRKDKVCMDVLHIQDLLPTVPTVAVR